MPRRRQRFSDLERQFRESGGQAAAGSRLAGYIAFKRGESQIQITQKLTSDERKRFGFAIIPFNKPATNTPPPEDRVAAPITAYSNAGRATVGLTDAILGYTPIVAETQQVPNFYPALLRVFVATSQTVTTPISAITKKPYNRTAGKSYGVPFGRLAASAATDTEEVRRSALATQAKTGTGGIRARSVSYEPELFKPGRSSLASPT